MSGKIRRIDFSPAEWLEGTAELDNATRGLYITACALMYARGGAIDRELLRAASRDHGHAFNRQLETLFRLGKLTVNDGQITNKRCVKEIQKAVKRMANVPQNRSVPQENNHLPTPCGEVDGKDNHQPSTINQEEKGSVAEEATGGDAPPAHSEPRPEPAPGNVVPFAPPEPPDLKKQIYDLGRQALGPKGGGQVTKLIKYHGGDLDAAFYTMRQTAAAASPPEYLGRILDGEDSAPFDHDAFCRANGIRPDGSSFGDDKWVSPYDRPGDDGRGNVGVA